MSNDTAYPRECPYCDDGQTYDSASAFDLHLHRHHSEAEADEGVAAAITDELRAHDE